MTSPAPDVWPSILTDYTYDSELDNADGVPHSVSTQLDVPGGEQLFPRKTVKCDRSHRDFWKCKLCDWKKNTVHLLKCNIRLITISHRTEKQDLLLTNVFYCNIFTVMKLTIWKLQPKRQSRIKGYPVNMINTIAESFILMPMQKEGVFHSLPQRDVRWSASQMSWWNVNGGVWLWYFTWQEEFLQHRQLCDMTKRKKEWERENKRVMSNNLLLLKVLYCLPYMLQSIYSGKKVF